MQLSSTVVAKLKALKVLIGFFRVGEHARWLSSNFL